MTTKDPHLPTDKTPRAEDGFPDKGKTNKNLKWWLNQQEDNFLTAEDDLYVHEVQVVEFAKQFAEKELRESREVIEYYKDSRMPEDMEEIDTESFFHCSPLKKRDPAINGVMKSKYLRGGKRARAHLEKYPQNKELK